MIGIAPAIVGFLIMLGLMFLGLHVATAMFAVGLLGAAVYLFVIEDIKPLTPREPAA